MEADIEGCQNERRRIWIVGRLQPVISPGVTFIVEAMAHPTRGPPDSL